MMLRQLMCVLLLVPLAFASARAQTTSATTAAVTGTVTDDSGAVLPGVTVNLSGPAMMGAQMTVADETGAYRFVAIPPGEYTVAFELPGFATVLRERVRLTAGFTAAINVVMGLATLEESIVVRGESPVVDIRPTSIATTYDKETLASTPSARDYWAILSGTPAVRLSRIDVGGSAAGTQTGYTVFGTTGQNRPMVEGINSTEGTGAFGNYVDYGSFEEVSVVTGAAGAETPVPGVYTQLISKSGGNVYHGTFYGDFQTEGLQSYNIDADQIAAGVTGGGGLDARDVNRMYRYHDLNADIGGYAKRDRLWWYMSARGLDTSARYTNFPVTPHETHLRNFTTKLTYLLSANNKLIGYYQPSTKVQNNRLDRQLRNATTAIHLTETASFRQDYKPLLWKAEWNSVVTPSTYFEIRTGQFGYEWADTPNGSDPSYEDLSNNLVSGTARFRQLDRQRSQVLGSVTHFRNGSGGTHNMKVGWEVFHETAIRQEKAGSYDDVLHVLRNGAPLDVMLFQTPTRSETGLDTVGLFVSDTWELGSRVSLNLGLRYDRYRSFLPEQALPAGRFTPEPIIFPAVDDVITWNLFAPRLGISVLLTDDGKTVLKTNIGRYWWNPGEGLSGNANPNSDVWFRRYRWADANGDRVWQPGEEGQLTDAEGGLATALLDSSLQNSYTTEAAVWLEREVVPGLALRTGGVWRGERQLARSLNANQPFEAFTVPVSITDPGPDGIRGSADDGPAIQAFNLAAEYLDLPIVNLYTNVPGASDYYTWEITGVKRMSNGWSLMTGFSHTWSATTSGIRSPNDLLFSEPDGQRNETDWSFKVSGTFDAPLGLSITPLVRHQSGENFNRTIVASLNYGNATIPVELLDTRRADNVTIVDLRLERTIRLSGSMTLAPFIDGYNLFNANPVQNITSSSGSSFLRPTNIVPPRIMRLGAKLNW